MSGRAVFLHGFTGRGQSWRPVLQHLPADLEAWCPDVYGHDPGAPLPSGSDFDAEIERLTRGLDERAWDRALLVGYSMGARIALGLLHRHPERFRGAVLIGGNPGLDDPSARQQRAAADEALARRLERDGIAAFVDHWQKLPLFASQARLPEAVLEEQRATRLAHRADHLAAALRVLGLAQMPPDLRDLERLDLPVSLMVGERDAKFRAIAEQMLKRLPRGSLRPIPGAGHNLTIEAPREVAAAVLDLLQKTLD